MQSSPGRNKQSCECSQTLLVPSRARAVTHATDATDRYIQMLVTLACSAFAVCSFVCLFDMKYKQVAPQKTSVC